MLKKSSHRWMEEHQNDQYVKQANKDGYRSRAVYKLEEIDAKDKLLHPNMTIVDLGAAPGGWSQWVQKRLDGKARIFALDILPMDSLPNVTFIQGDFREQVILDKLLHELGEHKANLVMSDMSPNISGMKVVDQPRAMYLAELAKELAVEVLAENGHFLTKIFQGEGFDNYLQELRHNFKKVIIRKPNASRARSPEVYILAKNFTHK